jgi:hypothetical protein
MLIYIQEAIDTNHGWHTNYCKMYRGFSQSLQGNARIDIIFKQATNKKI